jgi:hypothetical protein
MKIQHALLHLYPRSWRERYEDEVLAMLEQRSLSFTDGVNLLFGALDAQLHPHLGTNGPLFLLTVPILAFAVFLGTTLFLEAIDHPGNNLSPVWQIFLHRGLFFGVLITAAIVSTGAVCFAVVRSEISEKLLRFAVLPFILATISMALILAATIIWGLGLRDGAPQLFAGNDGIVGTSTTGTWLSIVIVMAIATLLAVISLLRGLSARSALRTATA